MASARVVVCNTVPRSGEIGGSELFAVKLTDSLIQAGHRASLLTFPGPDRFRKESLRAACQPWLDLDLTKSADVVIPLRFPTWVVRHPNKVVYLNHQLRIAYDLFDQPFGPSKTEKNLQARQFVMAVDNRELANAKRVLSVSRNVQQRLKAFNGLDSDVVYHGLPQEGRLRPGGYGDYVLSVGRLVPMKRVDLLIRAMALTGTPVRCLIAGEGPGRAELERLIYQLQLEHRVILLGRVPDDDLVELYANALGVYYAPIDEDYGLVTLEAFSSAKPVLTTPDAGGVLEFVQDGISGRVLAPDPAAFAEAIDQLYLNPDLAPQWGAAGAAVAGQVSWDRCIAQLEAHF